MEIELKPFCGTEEFWPYLHDPFSHGDHTYASDSSIVVRVQRRDSVPPNADDSFVTRFPEFVRMFEAALTERAFGPLPEAVLIAGNPGNPCPDCTDADADCVECDGDRIVGVTPDHMRFDAYDFRAEYIDKIRALPSLEVSFGTGPVKNQDLTCALMFRFDGGSGSLMPVHRSAPVEVVA